MPSLPAPCLPGVQAPWAVNSLSALHPASRLPALGPGQPVGRPGRMRSTDAAPMAGLLALMVLRARVAPARGLGSPVGNPGSASLILL